MLCWLLDEGGCRAKLPAGHWMPESEESEGSEETGMRNCSLFIAQQQKGSWQTVQIDTIRLVSIPITGVTAAPFLAASEWSRASG